VIDDVVVGLADQPLIRPGSHGCRGRYSHNADRGRSVRGDATTPRVRLAAEVWPLRPTVRRPRWCRVLMADPGLTSSRVPCNTGETGPDIDTLEDSSDGVDPTSSE